MAPVHQQLLLYAHKVECVAKESPVPLVEFLLIDLVIDQRKIVYQFTRINRVHLRQLFECLPLLKSWPISMGYYSLWCKKLYSNNPCLFSPS